MGKYAATILIAAVAAVTASLPAAGDNSPAGQPAGRPATEPDPRQQLAGYVEQIDRAEHPSQAARAYSRALAIDNRHAPAHKAYLRKMLEFGLFDIARTPARALINIRAKDGVAWGLMSYFHAKKEEPVEALEAIVRAARYAPENPGVMHNAGQLVAWYERAENIQGVRDTTKRIIDKSRQAWLEQKDFADAYEKYNVLHAKHLAGGGDVTEQIESLRADVEARQTSLKTMDRQVRQINAEINEHEREIDRLRDQLLLYSPYVSRRYYVDDDGNRIIYPGYYEDLNYSIRAQIREDIRAEEAQIAQLRGRISNLRQRGRAELRKLRAAETRLKQLKQKREAAVSKMERFLYWTPPAVNGKIVSAGGKFTAPPALERQPKTPAEKAAFQVEKARLLLENGRPHKAAAILKDVLEEYPDTDQAKTARQMLAGIESEKK